jgi:hypothetical protein
MCPVRDAFYQETVTTLNSLSGRRIGMRFLSSKALWLFPGVLIAVVSITGLGLSQVIEREVEIGPEVEIGYQDIDYIKINEPPGNNVVPQPCTRLQGTGLPQYRVQFHAYGWNNGPNGIPEDGGGDDIRLGRVRANWSTEVSPETMGSIDSNGLFTAAVHEECGDGRVLASYRHYREGMGFITLTDQSSIAVIPPDWLPDAPRQDLSKVGSDKADR